MSERAYRGIHRIHVTGMGIVCSIGQDVSSFGKALRDGTSGIRSVACAHEHDAAFAATIHGFDLPCALAQRSALPGGLRSLACRLGARLPFALQVAIASASEAWESAGLFHAFLPAHRVGLVVAGSNLTAKHAADLYPKFLKNPAHVQGSSALRLQDTDHVGVLTQIFGIRGEGYTVGGASASGNIGIINASRLIECGAVDACLVVGALADLSPLEKQAYYNIGAMQHDAAADPECACLPFDMGHAGFVYGQGSACLVLESEDSVNQRRQQTLAELAGYDLKLDANSSSAPSEEGEALVMSNALCRAGLQASDLAYINAHGTGSPLGDCVELRAIRRALGKSFPAVWVNSTKALTGHCLTAAGVVKAVATILQIAGQFVHPNIHLSRPMDRECRLVGVRAQPAKLKYALSNGFGFGGFNTSLVLASPHR